MTRRSLEKDVLALRRWRNDSMARALHIARSAYRPMERDDGTPYIDHPLRVTITLAKEFGVLDEGSLLLAVLHDASESPEPPSFPLLADLPSLDHDVLVLGTKVGATRKERDAWYADTVAAASLRVRLVKLADRLDNVRSLRTNPNPDKVARYVDETVRFYLPMAADTFTPALNLLQSELGRGPLGAYVGSRRA